MSNIVVTEFQGQLVVDSRIIAEQLGIQHKNFIDTVRNHRLTLEANFGLVAFETRPDSAVSAYLTEDQATFLMTLSRNTPQVLNCKVNLVKAFSQQKKLLKQDLKLDKNEAELNALKFTTNTIDMVFSSMFEPAILGQLKLNAALKIRPDIKPLLEESKQLLINATATVDKLCTVTEIAAQLNISAVALNKLLIEKGLQIKVPTTSKTQSKYIPTEQGKSYSKFTQSVDTSGTTFSSLRWVSNVINLLH